VETLTPHTLILPLSCDYRYDDDEFASGDGPASKRGPANLLKKYDNIDVITGDEKLEKRGGFSLDAAGGADLAREREAAAVRERLKASATSLDYEVRCPTHVDGGGGLVDVDGGGLVHDDGGWLFTWPADPHTHTTTTTITIATATSTPPCCVHVRMRIALSEIAARLFSFCNNSRSCDVAAHVPY
jgi:hypothetical protein